MAKQSIPQSFIDDILARTNLAELIAARLSMKRSGSNWYGCCPFHQEKTASFSVSEHKQFFYCFGCKASGNAIKFMMDYHNFSFPEAVEQLAGELGMAMPELENTSPKQNQSCYSLLNQVTEYYQQALIKTPQAHQYLKKRGLSDKIINQFRLGFSPPEWDSIKKRFGQKTIAHQDLIRSGMLIEKNQRTYDRFRGRIMFPIINTQGKIIAFGGRVLNQETPKYLNSPETELFQKNNELFGLFQARQATTKLDKLLVVEGYMDVISLANEGINYAVACLGTAITHGHIKKLLKQSNHIIFCFDGDKAGQIAAWKALTTSLPHANDGVNITFCHLPPGEDPDTYIQKNSKADFESLLSKSLPLSSFFFNYLIEQYGNDSIDKKAALGQKAKQLIETMPEGIFKSLLHQELKKTIQLEQAETPTATAPPTEKLNTPTISPIRAAIMMTVHQPKLAEHIHSLTFDPDNPGESMLNTLTKFLHTHPQIHNTAQLLHHSQDMPWYSIIHRLACQDLTFSFDNSKTQLLEYIKKHHDEKKRKTIQQLITKSGQETLSEREKEQLQNLILEQKS